jgi:hypothetical protein
MGQRIGADNAGDFVLYCICLERRKGKWKEESSFCEQKEAKKLCPLEPAPSTTRRQVTKVLLLLFFQKKKTLAFPALCLFRTCN